MKKRIMILAASVLTLTVLCLASCLGAKPGQKELESSRSTQPSVRAMDDTADVKNTITASGLGKVVLKPDMATLTLGVTTTAEKAVDASTMNAEELNKVIAALEGAGVKKEDISTYNYSINASYDYSAGSRKFIGYEVSNILSIKVNEVDKASEYLDVAVSAGANSVQAVSFGVKDSSAAYAQALEAAVKDAKAKAEVLAKAAGISGTLTPVAIEEAPNGNSPMYIMQEAKDANGMGATPIMGSDYTVTATVRVEYRFN